MKHKIFRYDSQLAAYSRDFDLRALRYRQTLSALLGDGMTLSDFANGHEYFGFHKCETGWFYREWAPGAEELYLTGDFCGWDREAHPMKKLQNGVFELFLDGRDTLKDGMKVLPTFGLLPYINIITAENIQGLLLLDRISPVLLLLPALGYMAGYLRGPVSRSYTHGSIAANTRRHKRKQKKEQKARQNEPKQII